MIFTVPECRRYWVVRAEGGYYYDHFIKHKVIALGHLNDVASISTTTDATKPFFPTEMAIKNYIIRDKEGEIDSTINPMQVGQIKSFIHDMSVGDWVLTIGHQGLRIGRIVGHPRFNEEPLKVTYSNNPSLEIEMPHKLRRSVKWGPEINRSKLPYGLLLSLKANQTLFNIDKHWEAVCHTFYPIFKRGTKLYLSSRINEESQISNYYVTSLLAYLNDIEVIAKEFDRGINSQNFEKVFDNYVEKDLLTITTQAQFHSPGEIWNAISNTVSTINFETWVIYACVGYGMLFGNHKLGFDGLIDLETRQKLWGIFLQRMETHNVEKSAKKLELSAPKFNTDPLEDSSEDEDSSNDET